LFYVDAREVRRDGRRPLMQVPCHASQARLDGMTGH
jgi:hypothetical protein